MIWYFWSKYKILKQSVKPQFKPFVLTDERGIKRYAMSIVFCESLVDYEYVFCKHRFVHDKGYSYNPDNESSKSQDASIDSDLGNVIGLYIEKPVGLILDYMDQISTIREQNEMAFSGKKYYFQKAITLI